MSSLSTYKGKRVFVGLSGGVDSSVTAALLQKASADVVGVFIQGWYPPGMPCTWAQDRRDAMRTAAHLRIPFHTLDASKEYKASVIDYLLREYKAGRTPNPDIMCNREVKFGAFYNFARAHGADFIATGHYAQSTRTQEGAQLLRGVDESKDQSYFLWAISNDALARTIFPLGGFEKSVVRTLAQKFGLPTATKRDSQGICFLGSISVEEFLTQEFGQTPGNAVDANGPTVGIHTGALLHTLGERIALTEAAAGPWYVLSKDIERNELVVSHERILPGNDASAITLIDTNWLGSEPTENRVLTAQYRYHGPKVEGAWQHDTNSFVLLHPITEPLAQGQSLVLYEGEQCVGGGIIS